MSGKCYKCAENCILKEGKTETFGFPCDQCRRIVCKNCAGLTASEVRVVVIPNRVMPFYCPSCRENNVPALTKRISSLELEIQGQSSDLKGKFVTLEQRMVKMEQLVESNKQIEQRILKIEQLIESNKQIEKELNDLKKIMENKNEANQGIVESEDIINEIMERKRRENNIIILNIKESALINKSEREKEETDTVKKLFIEGDINIQNFKVMRLGKYEVTKTRPIKIIFNNSEQPIEVLKKKRQLINKIPSIKIFRDQTPKQREYFKKIQNKLQEIINNGDNEKTIKYINNVPTIVNKKYNPKNFRH